MADRFPIQPNDQFLGLSRAGLLAIAAVAIAAIAWIDWYLGVEISLGVFYLLPVILLSGVLTRVQIIGLAVLCAGLRLELNPTTSATGGALSAAFGFLAYAMVGLLASELGKHRKEILRNLDEIRHQQALRRDAEEQLRILAEGSPAAVFTLDNEARFLSANRATSELLGFEDTAALVQQSVGQYLPVLAEALKLDTGSEAFRTSVQIQGKRKDGSPFMSQVCFSTYRISDTTKRMAVIAFDLTEETREREEQSQEQMLQSNRIIAGAVAHEVRNVCAAISVVHANLRNVPGVADNRDYQALGNLVTGLGGLARLELSGSDEIQSRSSELGELLDQLRILIGPAWEAAGASLNWPDFRRQVLVAADSFALLQAFLNIANNSLAAVSEMAEKKLSVLVRTTGSTARIVFSDSGPGVANPESLFQPFRSGAGKVGLGLYISRAMLRRYGGDVRYEHGQTGTNFMVEVPLYGVSADVTVRNERHPATAGR